MMSRTRAYNWFICLVAASCMTLYGFDSSVFNALQGSNNWLTWFNLDIEKDSYTIGLINTCYTIGAIVSGFFIGGPIADYLGRRWGMGIGCFVTVVAAIIQAIAPKGKLSVFIVGRVLIGIGQGTALTAGPVYINEVVPAQIRGKVMTFWQLNYSVGAFIAYWINYACSLNREKLGQWDWRMVVVFQIMVPIIIIAALPFQPESPRWYVKKNRVDEARTTLRSIRDTEEEVEEELLAIREAIEYENEMISPGYSALFKDKSVRKRFGLAVVLNVGQQLTGQGTLNTYSTQIYKKVWESETTINLINALWATFGILFTLNAAWTADRFGRRWLFMVGALGMAACMLIVPVIGIATPNDAQGHKSQPVAIGIVIMLFLFIFFYKPSWGATVWMWTAEIFSANVRSQAIGMASQCQNVANTVFQQFFPKFLQKVGLKCLFFFMAVNLLLAVFVYFFIPETKGIALEQMDVIFGGTDHTEKGAQMLGVGFESQHNPIDTKDGAEIQEAERRREGV
ncbi:general substrate transporter [Dactylonectria macrodidyma]|uniref:General substrate transporter n=1 Tax=Dactylonectria macrodidyma TaxID=307937 RepID=A0A9P9JHQ5_9HYPO|nr:general substrate transporter [Dactylonectria macrodidyma]